jgi:hypothetical protein
VLRNHTAKAGRERVWPKVESRSAKGWGYDLHVINLSDNGSVWYSNKKSKEKLIRSQWMRDNEIGGHKGETYWELRTWLLRSGRVQHIKLSESDPFVLGSNFYGETFEAALDADRLASKKEKPVVTLPFPT